MTSISQQKETLMNRKELLLKEIESIDSNIELLMESIWKQEGELIEKNIDSLLELS